MRINERELRQPYKLEQLFSTTNVSKDDLQRALTDACQLGYLTKSVKILLDNGANPNVFPKNDSPSYGTYNRGHSSPSCSCYNTPLQLCVINDDCKTAELLLSKNANPNLINENLSVEAKPPNTDDKNEYYWCRNYPPLHLATRHGHATMVSLLLRWGAEQSALIETGEFPVHVAAREGHVHLIEFFCSLDSKWKNWRTEMPKYKSGDIKVPKNETPLHIASRYGHVDCVSLLLYHLKADYQARDGNNNTVLHSLVDVPPVVNASSFQKDSENRFAIATLLVRCSEFDINGINSNNLSAFNLAAKNHYSKISQLLNDLGAKSLDLNNNGSNNVSVEVYSNDDDDDDDVNLNNNNNIVANKEEQDKNSDQQPLATTMPSTIVSTTVTTTAGINFKNVTTIPATSVVTTAPNTVPIVTTILTEKKVDIEPQKYFYPSLDNEISSFNLSSKDKSDRLYVSFDKNVNPKSPGNKSALTSKTSNDKNKENEPKYTENKVTAADDKFKNNTQPETNKKYDPILMKKVTSKDISIKKTTIFTTTLDDSPEEHNQKHRRRDPNSPVFDPNTTVLTIRCPPRSSSPLSFLSEGGRTRGLKLRVYGEVPKAYTKKQKKSARTDFILADPIGIESTEDQGDRSRLSVNSLPEYYFQSDLWQKAVDRREEWSKPLRPVISEVDKPMKTEDKKLQIKKPPVCDPNFKRGGVRLDGKLIGFVAQPYKTFGQIDTKTDALENAMQDISDNEDDDNGQSVETYDYNKYPIKEWLSGGRGNNYCPLESGEEFSSPEEKSVLRPKPKPYKDIDEDDEIKRSSSSSVKVDDINFRIVQMPDIDSKNVIKDPPIKVDNRITIDQKKPTSPKTQIPTLKSPGSSTVTSTVVSSFQPAIQTIDITNLDDDEGEENNDEVNKHGKNKKIPHKKIKPSNSIDIPGTNEVSDKSSGSFKQLVPRDDSFKMNKENGKNEKIIKRKTKEETITSITNEFKIESNDKMRKDANVKNDSVEDNRNSNGLNSYSPDKKPFKSKIPVYKPQISNDKKSNKEINEKNNISDDVNEVKEKEGTKVSDGNNDEREKKNEKQVDPNIIQVNDDTTTNLRENNFPNKTLDVFVTVTDPKTVPKKGNDSKINMSQSEDKTKHLITNEKDDRNDQNLNNSENEQIPPSTSNSQNNHHHNKSHAHEVPCVRIKKKSRPKMDETFINSVQNQLIDDPNANWTQKVITTMINSNFWKDETEKNEYQHEIYNLDEQIDKYAGDKENIDSNKKEVEHDENIGVNKEIEDDDKNVLNRTFDKNEDKNASFENESNDTGSIKKKNKKKVKKNKSVDDSKSTSITPAKDNDIIVSDTFGKDEGVQDENITKVDDDENAEGDKTAKHVLNRTFEKDSDEKKAETGDNGEKTLIFGKIRKKIKKSKSVENPDNMPDIVNDNNVHREDDQAKPLKKKKSKCKKLNEEEQTGVVDQTKDFDSKDEENLKSPQNKDANNDEPEDHNTIENKEDDNENGPPFQNDTNNLDVLIPVYPSNTKESENDKMNSKVRRDHLIHSIEHEDDEDDVNNLNQVIHAHSTDDDKNNNENQVSDGPKSNKKIRRQKSKKKSTELSDENESKLKSKETDVDDDEKLTQKKDNTSLIPVYPSNTKESENDKMNSKIRRDLLIHSIEHEDDEDDVNNLNQVIHAHSTDDDKNNNENQVSDGPKSNKKIRRQKSKKKSTELSDENESKLKSKETDVDDDEKLTQKKDNTSLIPVYPSNTKESENDKMNSKIRRDHLIHSIEHEDDEDDVNNLNQVIHAHSTDDDKNNNENQVSDGPKSNKKIRRQKSKKKSTEISDEKQSKLKSKETNVDDDEKLPKSQQYYNISEEKDYEKNIDKDESNIKEEDQNKKKKTKSASTSDVFDKQITVLHVDTDDRNKNKANDDNRTDMNKSIETNVDDLFEEAGIETGEKDKNLIDNNNDDDANDNHDEDSSFPPPPPPHLLKANSSIENDDKDKKPTQKKDNTSKKQTTEIDDDDLKPVEDDASENHPFESNKKRKSDETTNNGFSDSENNSSDPDASNYLEYHVDMDPRVSGKFRIRKTKHIYQEDEDNDKEEEFIKLEDENSDNKRKDIEEVADERLEDNKSDDHSNKDADGNDDENEYDYDRKKRGKKVKTNKHTDNLMLTETTTTTTVIVDEELINKTKKKKKKKIKEKTEDDITNAVNNTENKEIDNDESTKNLPLIIDKECDGYTSDDINVVDNYENDDPNKDKELNEASDNNNIVKGKKKSKKNKSSKKIDVDSMEPPDYVQTFVIKNEIDDDDKPSFQTDKTGGKKSFEIFSGRHDHKDLIIVDNNDDHTKDNETGENNNLRKPKKKKSGKNKQILTKDNEDESNTLITTKIDKIEKTDEYVENFNDEARRPSADKKQKDIKDVERKQSKETIIDDINDQDLSSELSTTESAMNSYELTKKNGKSNKKKLNSLTTDDSGINTNASLEMVITDENSKDKTKRKQSKSIKEEDNDLTNEVSNKEEIHKKRLKNKTDIRPEVNGEDNFDDENAAMRKTSHGSVDVNTLTKIEIDEEVNKKGKKGNNSATKKKKSKLDNNGKSSSSKENEDSNLEDGFSAPNKKKIKIKNGEQYDGDDDNFMQETVTTTKITTHEEWLEQQRRLKNKNKIDSSDKNDKEPKKEINAKQTYETNFDAEAPFEIDDNKHKFEDPRKKNEDSDSGQEIVTEVLSPGTKPPLIRNIKPLVHPGRESNQKFQRQSFNASDPEISSSQFNPKTNGKKEEGLDDNKDQNWSKQKGHVPRQYSAHSKSFEENINTTTTVVETVITDRWKRRSRRRPKSVSFDNIPRRKPQIQDRPLTIKAPDKTLEQAAFEMLQVNQAETWRKNWKTNPVVYTRGVYRPQQPLYKRDGGVDGNASFKHDESRISQAFPPWSDMDQYSKEGANHGGTMVSSDGLQDTDSSPQHNTEDGIRYNENVEEYVVDEHAGGYHVDQYGHEDTNFESPPGRNMPPGSYGKGISPILFNSISRKITYVRPIKRRRGYNSLSLYPIRGTTNQTSKDLPPRVSEPVPSDLNKYGYLSKLWMEQVDRKTLQKCETMYLSVLPKGMRPPGSIEDTLFKRYLNNKSLPNDPKAFDTDGSQWVIARGRSVRQAKRKWLEQKENKLFAGGEYGNTSFADVTGNVSPTRSTANRSFAGNVTSPGPASAMLFFKIGQINWPDLAWVLFDGIQSDAETVRTIADVRLKHPDDCGAQVRDLMARWWIKKGDAATIEELQTALEFVKIPFVQEEDHQASFFYPAKDGEDDHLDEEALETYHESGDPRKSLLLKEVSENDPDVSRMLFEYDHRSPNVSFAAIADHSSQQIHLLGSKSASGNLLQVPSFQASKQLQKQQEEEEDHSPVNLSFSSALRDKFSINPKSKSTSKQNSLSLNMPESSTNLGSQSSFCAFTSNIFGGKHRKSKNDSILDASTAEEEVAYRTEKPYQKSYLAKNVDLESNI